MTDSNDPESSRLSDVTRSANESVVVDVVIQVSNALGTAPDDLTPLERVIDTEALESLVTHSDTATIEFEYEGCEVTVDADRAVHVDPPTQELS